MHRFRTRLTVAILATGVGVSLLVGGCGSAAHHPADARPDSHAVPSHLRWTVFQGVLVPIGDQGPRQVEGPVATGYDQSSAGAALAAIESSVRVGVADDTQRAQVGQQLLAPGPGRDRWAIARWQINITEPVDPKLAPRVLGYMITGYNPAKVSVDIYAQQADRSITRTSTTVVRRGDSWLLELPATPGRPVVAAVATTPRDMVVLRHTQAGAR